VVLIHHALGRGPTSAPAPTVNRTAVQSSQSPSPSPAQRLALGTAARASSQFTNGQDPPAQFDIAVLDFTFTQGDVDSLNRMTTPPPGAQFVLYLIRATNVSQVRGRPPGVGVKYRGLVPDNVNRPT